MTTLNSSTLRPGLLVSLKTTVSGNVQYQRQTTESEHVTETGAARAAWETTRVIDDPAEHEAATKARGKARSLIAGACAYSSFGLLCPDDQIENLERAILEARQVAASFNLTARLSRVAVYVMTARVAQDDVEAVRAINSEVRDLLDAMQAGVQNLDVKAIRDAANKARSLGAMLSPEAAERIQVAIDTARQSARQIVKAGEQAAQEVDRQAIRKIVAQRTAFLDLDDVGDIGAPEAESRAIDLAPEPEAAEAHDDEPAAIAAPPAPALLLDL